MRSDAAIPGIIRADGDEAVEAYRSYFDDAIGNRNTRECHGNSRNA